MVSFAPVVVMVPAVSVGAFGWTAVVDSTYAPGPEALIARTLNS